MAEHRVVSLSRAYSPNSSSVMLPEADGRTVDLRVEVFGGLLRRLEARDLKAARAVSAFVTFVKSMTLLPFFMFRPRTARDFSLQPVGPLFAEALAETSRASQTMKKAVGSISFTSRLTATISRRRDSAEQHGLVIVRIGSLGGQAGDAHIACKQLVRDFLLLVGWM